MACLLQIVKVTFAGTYAYLVCSDERAYGKEGGNEKRQKVTIDHFTRKSHETGIRIHGEVISALDLHRTFGKVHGCNWIGVAHRINRKHSGLRLIRT
jgi:hypothetical protein